MAAGIASDSGNFYARDEVRTPFLQAGAENAASRHVQTLREDDRTFRLKLSCKS